MTLDQFIQEEQITADVEYASSNPNMSDMPYDSSHWLVTIYKDRESMAVPFSQGPAITREPTLADVLDCLASDAATIDNARTFDEWAEDLGFFPMESSKDYHKAEQTYNAVNDQSEDLRRLLGDDAYQTLLYETERL